MLSIKAKLSSPLASTQQRLPYSMVFLGVNGVGKSTNLAKVCFWLRENGFNVLIAACDTFRHVPCWLDLISMLTMVFRSGAVEQLRKHVSNLGKVESGVGGKKGVVELFERGYGKDAAGIAKEAITYGKQLPSKITHFNYSVHF